MKMNQYRRLGLSLQQQARQNDGKHRFSERLLFEIHRQYHRCVKSPFLDVHHKTRSIYIHVPKTGGNTVTQTLYHKTSKHAGSHRAAWEYQVNNQALFDSYFVFAMVRHPLLRMRSAFYYLKNGGMNASDQRFGRTMLAQHHNFLDFLRAVDQNKVYQQKILNHLHFLPQSYFLCDIHGQCIVPHLLRQEHFAAELTRVCEKLNIPYQARYDNPTPRHAFSSDTLTGFAAKICFNLYKQDYPLLGYDKALPETH